MNCRVLSALLALLLVCSICDRARAELRFDKTSVDIGKIRGGPYLSYVLYFTNVGQQPVQILDARASCTCMQPLVAPPLLYPGQRGALQLTINTIAVTPGQHTWTARVSYQEGTTPGEASVQVSASYTPEVSVTPANLTMQTDNSTGHEVTVTDVRQQPLKIVGIESSSQYLQAAVTKQQRNLRGHFVGTIALQTRNDLPPGRHEETVSIYTDDQQYRQLQVGVTIIKKAGNHVSVHPNRVTLHAASEGKPTASQLVRVHSTGTEAIAIRRITSSVPGFSGRWAPGPGVDATVRVQADRPPNREVEGVLQIELDRPAHETISVPFTFVTD